MLLTSIHPSCNTPCCLSSYLRNLLKLLQTSPAVMTGTGRECMRRTPRTDENEEDSKAGEVDNMRWMFMRASSTKTFLPPSPISGGLPNSHAKSGGESNERSAADLVTLPSESDLRVLPMNHLSRVVRRRRIGRCPPLILFLFRQPPAPS